MTSASDEKWRLFNFSFQSREQMVVRRDQIRRIGWVIKIGALSCKKKKLNDNSRLHVVEIARVA